MVRRHQEKLRRWQNLAPPLTRVLIDQIVERLVPVLEGHGFSRVGYCLGDPQQEVSGGELRMERRAEEVIDSVTFNFEKYKSPRVQVHLSRRRILPPNDFVHSGNLVARKSQYLHFWGKPWWLPTQLWSRRGVARAVTKIERGLEQADHFLRSGERGPNISKKIVITGFRAIAA